jgi:phosphomethylpyrimidine synthase
LAIADVLASHRSVTSFCSMKISHGIREEYGAALDEEAEAGMRAKAEEFAASGNRVYLPLATAD